jgi:hypothetical protein
MRPRRGIGLAAFGLALALASAGIALAAQEENAPLLRAEFWIEREPVSSPSEPWPVPLDEARRRLLDEAAWVYSGMVWGFDFEYAPYDKTRGIAESFRPSPIESLSAADPALKAERLAPSRTRYMPSGSLGPEGELSAYVEYRPGEAEARLMAAYSREPWVRSQGIGRADIVKGWRGRRAAYEDALRVAVREYLRSIEPNKPRGAKGRVVFERPPSIAVRDGFYLVQASARIEVLELKAYGVY